METERQLIGIEVKAGRNVSPADARGLVSLGEIVGRERRFKEWIVYHGERKQRFDNGVEAWPVIEALEALR